MAIMLRYFLLSRTIRTLLIAACLVVCAHTQGLTTGIRNGYARLTVQSGQVSVLRGAPIALFVGDEVKRQEMIVTGHEGYAKFEVSDGSYFEIFQDSKVVFHDNPTVTYTDLLNVLVGRIKVFIQHLNGPNYNSVKTPTAVISVRGTVFIVDVEDDDVTTVAVDEGLVDVRNTTASGNAVLLKTGDAIRVIRGQGLIGKLIDHGQIRAQIVRAVEDAARLATQRAGGGIGMPGTGGATGGGAQGDQNKKTGGSGTGSSTGSSAPPAGPKPGGGGN